MDTYLSADQELSEEQRAALPIIQKIMRHAQSTNNAEEAATFMARAQDMLLKHNLDASILDEDLEGGARAKDRLLGGAQDYQKSLWEQVARLNFCMHWNNRKMHKHKRKTKYSWHHNLVGRKRNVAATIAMARYLEQAVDRAAMDFVHGDNAMRYSRRANSFREGAIDVIVRKLYDRRQHLIAEEKRREIEAREAAIAAGAIGVSLETSVTISSLTQTEEDENMDFLAGEKGYSARKRAERAAAAAARVKAEQEYTAWAAAHPEQAAAEAAERRKEEEEQSKRRRRSSGRQPRGREYDEQAYYSGREKGKDIGIDLQTDADKPVGFL
jgi:hypothetical protein